jgi:lysozyme
MNIREQLMRDEGCVATAYQDSVGVWTVGYGHNLAVPLSHEAMQQILQDDLEEATESAMLLPEYAGLSDARKGVIVNMIFNLGPVGYSRFVHFRHSLTTGDYDRAATEMLDSTWATQVGARATRLATQMRTDEWQ